VSLHHIASSDGTRIAVEDTGPPDAPTFVLIHGWAQARLAWEAQAPLAARYRLLAMDLRGHGDSDAPEDPAAYTDTQLWGDDVRAVLDALQPRSPVLVGWSYGARVIGAYLSTHGAGPVVAIALAGGLLALGAAREPWMAGPDSPGMTRALYTGDDAARAAATRAFVAACTHVPLDPAFTARLIAANDGVSALVRRALFQTDVDLRPVWAVFDRPALVVHGAQDTVIPASVGQVAARALPQAELRRYEACGHAPFLEHPTRFNADLAALAARITP
jgi:pimeloyl-ACP methyl ester carboxylesterase